MTTEEQSTELSSLGFIVKRRDVDTKEIDDLINLLKMQLYHDYKDTYNDSENP